MSGTFGPAYEEKRDGPRIGAQRWAVLHVMLGGNQKLETRNGIFGSDVSAWWTLGELEEATGYPQASISAQLRHLRKKEFGAYVVEKRRRENGCLIKQGTWEYRVSRPRPAAAVQLSLGMTA